MFVNIPDNGAHAPRVATGSLVMIFEPRVIGTLVVGPYTQYAYSWLVAGFWYIGLHSWPE
jgi:hypothetical protein